MGDLIQNSRFKIQDLRFKIQNLRLQSVLIVAACSLFFFLNIVEISAQKLAVLTPLQTAADGKFAGKLAENLSANVKIIDPALGAAVFNSASFENPFNLSLEESKNVGAAIGCNFFLLVESAATRRETLNSSYYESYAVVYLVNSRSGKLIFWQINSFQGAKQETADKLLFDSIDDLSKQIAEKMKTALFEGQNEKPKPKLEEVPEENLPEAENFRAPVPYRRRKPVYPSTASLYGAKATVDVEVDIGADGAILRIETMRWAGYGLEEAVFDNIRQMNWRPAERNGKFLPMRVLLRYNFKKTANSE